MRKNIKKLIISLSVLAVAATVAAITVPLVMHANNVDDQNLNRDVTIKEAALVLNSGPIQRITKSNSESEILDIVKSTNETPNGWKDAFKLTNENGKIVKNAIKSVELVITRSPIVDGKQDIQLTFLITYNDGIKYNSESSIIKHKMPKNIVTSLDLVSDSVAIFTDLVNANLLEIKNNGLQTWLNKAETQGKIAKLLIAKQGETNVPVSLANSKDITTKGSLRYKIKITPIFDGGSQENIIFLAQNIVFPEISLEKIELALENSVGFDNKKIAATEVLKSELDTANTIADQKTLYDSWKTETPVAFKEALSELLVVTVKPYTWTDILKEIKIMPGTFPETVGLPIPSVSVEIILKDDFSASAATASLLKFDIIDLGTTTKQVSITKDANYDTKLTAATKVLRDALDGANTIADQKRIYDGWATTTPAGFADALKDIVIFDNGGLTWDNAFASVELTPGDFISAVDSTIPQVGITINLKTGYTATTDSVQLLSFNSGDLGKTKATTEIVVTDADVHADKLSAATKVLRDALDGADTIADQKRIYDGWKTTTPAGFADALKDIVIFDNGGITWDNAFASVELTPRDFISAVDSTIPQVGITINLKTGYTATTDSVTFLTFDSGDLGKTKATTEIAVSKGTDYDTKLIAATKVLRDELDTVKTPTDQKIIYDSWETTTPVGFADALKNIVIFDNGEITWDIAVKDVNITKKSELTEEPSTQIPPVTITIELKIGYDATESTNVLLSFDSGDLGSTKNISVTVTKDETNFKEKLDAATLVLSNALADATAIYEQKKIYDDWVTTTPNDFINTLKDIVTFDNGGITWDIAVKDVKITKNSELTEEPSTQIPPVTITIELNTGYDATESTKSFLSFDSGDLGLTKSIDVTVTEGVNFKEKLTAATSVLRSALDNAKTLDDQKALYESWATAAKIPAEFIDALKGIVTFDGGITWETAFEGVALAPGAFISAIGSKIPQVEITITLKNGYIATTDSVKFLTFNSYDLGLTVEKTTIAVSNDADYETKLTAATSVLRSALDNAKTLDHQKTIYDGWETTTPVGFADALKNIVIFDNGEITWDIAVKDVNITKNSELTGKPSTPIPAVTITIELNAGYDPESTISFLSFDSGDLGLTKSIDVTVTKGVNFQEKLNAATNVLKRALDAENTPNDQKRIYNDWENANPKGFADALKDIVTFDGDETKWNTIVKDVKITKSNDIHALPLEQIPPVKITIELNTEYDATESTKSLLSFDSDDLGLTKSIDVTVTKDVKFKEKLSAATSVLRSALDNAKTLDEQKRIYNNWGKANPEGFVDALKGIVKFNGGITWETAVKGVKITPSAFTKAGGAKIPPVKITIELKPGYIATNNTNKLLSFESDDLGNAIV